jgi:hypothetical protein
MNKIKDLEVEVAAALLRDCCERHPTKVVLRLSAPKPLQGYCHRCEKPVFVHSDKAWWMQWEKLES